MTLYKKAPGLALCEYGMTLCKLYAKTRVAQM